MPLRHSPPRSSPLAGQSTLMHSKSDTNLSSPPAKTLTVPSISKDHAKSDSNITARKRKREKKDEDTITKDDVQEMFSMLKKEQDEKYAALLKEQNEKFSALMEKIQSGINIHTEQNVSIVTSIEFLSQKYDEISQKMKVLEQEKNTDRAYIRSLESRLEYAERTLRSSSIEIRNVPKKSGETKDDLVTIIKKVGTSLNIPIQAGEIHDVYRINTRNEQNQPIVANFSSVNLRDNITTSVKTYNKKYPNNKFSTSNLKLEGPTIPIFISENLTAQTKKLFFLAREFAKLNGFRYCWASRGKIYLRKSDGGALVRVNNAEDLENVNIK